MPDLKLPPMIKDKFLAIALQMRATFPRNRIRAIVVDSSMTLDGGSVVFRVMLDPGGFRTNREQVSWSRNRDAALAQRDKCDEWLNEIGINSEIKKRTPEDEAMLLAALGPPDDK